MQPQPKTYPSLEVTHRAIKPPVNGLYKFYEDHIEITENGLPYAYIDVEESDLENYILTYGEEEIDWDYETQTEYQSEGGYYSYNIRVLLHEIDSEEYYDIIKQYALENIKDWEAYV